ncbi:MAG: VOC family protein [Lentisphaerae bacterium]|nr:VOC family protein [Lentisphaerota bacterium]
MDCEIVILAENIDVCRYFYRETLGLGEPVQDSAFQVIFPLNAHTRLVLEKCPLAYMEHASSACRFTLVADDLEKFVSRLETEGVVLSDGFDRSGRKILCAVDPEGNVFQITGKC